MNVRRNQQPEGRAPLPGDLELEDVRIINALEEYLLALEAGQKPNRLAFLAQHVEVARGLVECLDALEALHRLVTSVANPPPGTHQEPRPLPDGGNSASAE